MSRRRIGLNRRQWARLRLEVLDRDGWRRRWCREPGALEVDHVVPIAAGGAALALSNLQVLCKTCHIAKTAGENRREDRERDAWRAVLRDIAYR